MRRPSRKLQRRDGDGNVTSDGVRGEHDGAVIVAPVVVLVWPLLLRHLVVRLIDHLWDEKRMVNFHTWHADGQQQRLVHTDCVKRSWVGQFNACVKWAQIEISLSYCVLRRVLRRSERAFRKFFKLDTSVTRYCEISPLWQNFESLWGNFLDGLFRTWQTFVPTLAFLCYWANFHCCKWPKIE